MGIIYKCGSYNRLSKEDLIRKDESSSISSQKLIIKSFANFNNLEIVEEYVDDGFTGANFDRPDFNRMFDDIELGRINCVITKDLSRLGRDYIDTGYYLERYFPKMNVRYIAINDGYDSNVGDSMLGIRLGVNDLYLRDTSRKIKGSFKAKQEQGLYIGSFPCYGYKKDLNDNHKLVIDEEVSNIVKKIFNMADENKGPGAIARELTRLKIPIPAVYKNEPRAKLITTNDGKGVWRHQTVSSILTSEMYIGNMVQNTYNKISYNSKKLRKVAKDNYVVVENTHEAIIDKDLFYRVGGKLKKKTRTPKTKIYYLFIGLLKCKDCGRGISVTKKKTKTTNYLYTCCNRYTITSSVKECSPHRVNYTLLEADILEFIKELGKSFVNQYDSKTLLNDSLKLINKQESDILEEIKGIDISISKNEDIIKKIYNDRLEDIITPDNFKMLSVKYEQIIKELKEQREDLEDKITNIKFKNNSNDYNKCKKIMNEYLSLKNPSKELINRIIDRIEIDEDKNIDVYFKLKPL